MTNFEAYTEQLKEIFCDRYGIDDYGTIGSCILTKCENCIFNVSSGCSKQSKRTWLEEEYVEPQIDWTKVPVDTPILVRDYTGQEWVRRYFAKYENGKVYAFSNGATSWSDPTYINKWEYAKLAEQGDKHGQAK